VLPWGLGFEPGLPMDCATPRSDGVGETMKALLIRCMFFTLASVTAWAQKIETPSPDPNQIIHVKTAMNHLTVIELGQPVTAVAAGSPAFKIEWRENKVFVQPTEAKLATNLFIWTTSGRMN